MNTWLIIDCNYICYRALYSTGNLSYGGDPTGVIYGFMRDVRRLQDRFAAYSHTVFCWDHGKGLREQVYPTYKSKRRTKKLTEAEALALEGLKIQVEKLKRGYLPDLDCINNFFQKGYEADDIIASVVNNTRGDRRIIVSADKDLYQLLRKRVRIYNISKDQILTRDWFEENFGVSPEDWPKVKAIAGCGSDDIAGIDGIGEKFACLYLRDELSGKRLEKIKQGENIIRTNIRLVTLPYPGCKDFKPQVGGFNERAWRMMRDQLGMDSLRDRETPRGFGLRSSN